jgi:hypothetical protein
MNKYIQRLFFSFFIIQISSIAHACSVCFYGSPEEKQNIALSYAVIGLLAFLVIIMVLFIKFLIGFQKRAKL